MWLIFPSVTHFFKSELFFQVWHNFPSVISDFFKCDSFSKVWRISLNGTHVYVYSEEIVTSFLSKNTTSCRTIKSFFVVQQNDSANPRYFCLISIYLRMGLRNFSFSCISLIYKLMKAEPTKTHPLNVIVLIILLQ